MAEKQFVMKVPVTTKRFVAADGTEYECEFATIEDVIAACRAAKAVPDDEGAGDSPGPPTPGRTGPE